MKAMHTVEIKIPAQDDCWFKVEARQDDLPVRGNAIGSGDSAYDKEVEDNILKELDNGNIWMWATIKVTCGFDDWPVTGTDYLGACSYCSEEDFVKANDYYQDMKEQAYADFVKQLEQMAGQPGKERA
jgi:hypothetical protein